jgi:hypothetical protein
VKCVGIAKQISIPINHEMFRTTHASRVKMKVFLK